MNRRGLFARAALLFTFAAAPRVSRAQEINLATLDDAEPNRVSLRTGAEHGFVAGLGYARTVRLLGRSLVVDGDVTVPWAGLDASDHRARVGVLVPIVSFGGWKLAAALAPTLRATKNDLARMTSLGVDASATVGYYARRWFAAGELGFDYALTTRINHSDEYRNGVYPGARDGWYINPGGMFRGGGQAGASLGRHDLALRAGVLRDMQGGPPVLPLYATLTFATRW